MASHPRECITFQVDPAVKKACEDKGAPKPFPDRGLIAIRAACVSRTLHAGVGFAFNRSFESCIQRPSRLNRDFIFLNRSQYILDLGCVCAGAPGVAYEKADLILTDRLSFAQSVVWCSSRTNVVFCLDVTRRGLPSNSLFSLGLTACRPHLSCLVLPSTVPRACATPSTNLAPAEQTSTS